MILFVIISAFLTFCGSKGRSNVAENHSIIEVKKLKKDSNKVDSLNDTPSQDFEALKTNRDSTFNYRLKAFEDIYFGSHNNLKDEKIELLDVIFTSSPREHHFFGLYGLHLSTKLASKDKNDLLLTEISILLDKKYGDGRKLGYWKKNGPSDLFKLRAFAILGKDFKEEELPQDESDDYFLKKWENSEVEITVGYFITYLIKTEKSIPNGYSFEKIFCPYIDFSNKFLENRISSYYAAEETTSRKKRLLENESKF